MTVAAAAEGRGGSPSLDRECGVQASSGPDANSRWPLGGRCKRNATLLTGSVCTLGRIVATLRPSFGMYELCAGLLSHGKDRQARYYFSCWRQNAAFDRSDVLLILEIPPRRRANRLNGRPGCEESFCAEEALAIQVMTKMISGFTVAGIGYEH